MLLLNACEYVAGVGRYFSSNTVSNTMLVFRFLRTPGMVINTMGWIEDLGYELLLHAVQTLAADVVVVLEQDRLHSQLSAALQAR